MADTNWNFLNYEGLEYYDSKSEVRTDEKIAVETERAKTEEENVEMVRTLVSSMLIVFFESIKNSFCLFAFQCMQKEIRCAYFILSCLDNPHLLVMDPIHSDRYSA